MRPVVTVAVLAVTLVALADEPPKRDPKPASPVCPRFDVGKDSFRTVDGCVPKIDPLESTAFDRGVVCDVKTRLPVACKIRIAKPNGRVVLCPDDPGVKAEFCYALHLNVIWSGVPRTLNWLWERPSVAEHKCFVLNTEITDAAVGPCAVYPLSRRDVGAPAPNPNQH